MAGDLNSAVDHPIDTRTIALKDALYAFNCWIVTPAFPPTYVILKNNSTIDIFLFVNVDTNRIMCLEANNLFREDANIKAHAPMSRTSMTQAVAYTSLAYPS